MKGAEFMFLNKSYWFMSNQYLKNDSKQWKNKDVRVNHNSMYHFASIQKQPEQEFKRVF